MSDDFEKFLESIKNRQNDDDQRQSSQDNASSEQSQNSASFSEKKPDSTAFDQQAQNAGFFKDSGHETNFSQSSAHNTGFSHANAQQNAYTGYTGYAPEHKKPKKDKKGMRPASVIAICIVLSLIVGIAGGVGGNYLYGIISPSSASGANVVMYKTVTLKDQSGNDVTQTLSVGEIADAAKDSVVEITTEGVTTGNFMMQYVTEGAGSGVILTQDGYIVTNNHVISDATSISVRTTDGTSYKAKIVGSDEKTDLAVLKIEAENLSFATFGDFSACKVGDTVVAIGNPLGQLGGTVTDGIISALDREITIDGNIMTLIQTNTAINPGNSGGGLFNTSGQLIGVVNAKSAGEDVEGLGFAIPINIAQPVIEDLIEYGYVTGRIETGIEVIEISDFQTAMYYRVTTAGLYVYSVENNSKADDAGFKPGDLIKSVDGQEITTQEDYDKIIDSYSVGDTLEVVVERAGSEQTLSLELTEYTPISANANAA